MEIGKIIGLKCPNCGAGLGDSLKEIQKCSYCGMNVHIEDASKYVEHLKGFIVDWMRTALPLGVGMAYSSSVDALARHNIFQFNILPRLNSEFNTVQMTTFEVFAKPLAVPPFVKYPHLISHIGKTKELFTYDAKIAAIEPFAISDDDQNNVHKMGGITRALAHVLIGIDALNRKVSYKLISENFLAASKSLESQYQVLSRRMFAVSEIYLAINELFEKKVETAKSRIINAKRILEETQEKLNFDINLSLCSSAVEEEIMTAKSINRIAEVMQFSSSNELEFLSKISSFFEISSNLEQISSPKWKNIFQNISRYSELSDLFSRIFESKRGESSIKVCNGRGNVLFPFWLASIKYTFGTGTLWMKKGVGVNENALIAATFPLNTNFILRPQEVLTDIFSNKSSWKENDFSESLISFRNSITGSETSISNGNVITDLITTAKVTPLSGYSVIPPLTTQSEAKQLMDEYLTYLSRTVQGKLNIASSTISELVLLPAYFNNKFIDFSNTLGHIQPENVGNISSIDMLLI